MMGEYSLEELLPIVAELAGKYTSNESTSISYDRANRLMEAVLYCIKECEMESVILSKKRLSAKEAYQSGRQIVFEKVKETKDKYNTMLLEFCAYGNENYYDTVTKALPGFFRYYDIQFAPQETIITMDYPILFSIHNVTGIDAVEHYVEGICLEQKFMGSFQEEYVYKILMQYQSNYRKQFYNLCSILLRHMLGCMMIGKRLEVPSSEKQYMWLEQTIQGYSKTKLKIILDSLIDYMIEDKWNGDFALANYLKEDTKNFVSELVSAVENHCLQRIVVL